MTRRILIGVAAAALAAAVTLLGGALHDSQGTAGTRAAAPPPGGTPGEIKRLQAAVRERPGDAARLSALGRVYELRARETADEAYLPRAERAFRLALDLHSGDAGAVLGLGSIALSRHEFRRALTLGRRAQRLDPQAHLALAVIGDALLELGRHDAAFDAFEQLAERAPGPAAYARVAYGRELIGDRAGAAEAMKLAAAAAAGRPEPSAWARVQLGNLHLGEGRAAAAAREYQLALRALPGYPYALDGLARAAAAGQQLARAEALARRAADAVPLPQFVATLADVLWVSGRKAEAREQRAVIGALRRLAAARGAVPDLELAQLAVDHGFRLPQALRLAREAHRRQPSLEGDDVLAWALIRNGRCDEGLRWSKRSLRLGTQDATRFFHRGMAERCLGRPGEARRWFRRALDLDPHFSLLWSPLARRLA